MIACAKCGITRSFRTSTPRQGAQRPHNASSVGCVNRPFGRAIAKSSAIRTSPTVMGTACNETSPEYPTSRARICDSRHDCRRLTRALYIAQQHQAIAAARDEWRILAIGPPLDNDMGFARDLPPPPDKEQGRFRPAD
jgi:hypothetical protein